MTTVLQFTLRGLAGFVLAGVILLGAARLTVPRAARQDESPSFVGEWQHKEGAIDRGAFGEDGTFYLLPRGGGRAFEGTYTLVDPVTARLVSDSPWTHVALVGDPQYLSSYELHFTNEEGASAQLRWFRKKAPDPHGTGGLGGLLALLAAPVIGAAVAGALLSPSVERATRAALGFGGAAVPATFIVLFTFISLQGGGTPEYAWGATGCGIAFAILGGVGGLCLRPKLAVPGALILGLAGALWGWTVFRMAGPAASDAGSQTPAHTAALLLLPLALGGALFGAVVGAFGVEE